MLSKDWTRRRQVYDDIVIRSGYGGAITPERIAERIVREQQGEPYFQPKVGVAFSAIDPVEVSGYREAELERLFQRAPSIENSIWRRFWNCLKRASDLLKEYLTKAKKALSGTGAMAISRLNSHAKNS